MVLTHCDGHGDTNEEHVCAEADRDQSGLFAELMIQSIGNGAPKAKGKGHAGSADAE